MAKKAAPLRVHQLAKELGVNSKEIVAKCQAESIPGIDNHMSAVNFGLAATIREWFGAGEGGTATAVETAPPVDIETVRSRSAPRKAKARAKSKAEGSQEIEYESAAADGMEESEDTIVAVAEPEAPARRGDPAGPPTTTAEAPSAPPSGHPAAGGSDDEYPSDAEEVEETPEAFETTEESPAAEPPAVAATAEKRGRGRTKKEPGEDAEKPEEVMDVPT
ncbi:MAG: translation initiation factor IF-2 N-terminal domain-containing protein, partial [Phycisphaerales bacterium]|nr:translation initiation factor IF-2 N-terminal domain-containing protein [Phycisphaerales bacterium]